MTPRLPADSIKLELRSLIDRSSAAEPALAKRLDDIWHWIKDKKVGLLTSKRVVLDFLTELILDAKLWLKLRSLNDEQKEDFFERSQLSPVAQYWYQFLFTQWIDESDPKLAIWKKRMMSGDYSQKDEALINSVSEEIEAGGGSCLYRHILDLSMATDLAVSGSSDLPLCVQLTVLAEKWLENKKDNWEATIRYWGVRRGLLVSINPSNERDRLLLADVILEKSDLMPDNGYAVHIF